MRLLKRKNIRLIVQYSVLYLTDMIYFESKVQLYTVESLCKAETFSLHWLFNSFFLEKK